jgi:hypothetical protein
LICWFTDFDDFVTYSCQRSRVLCEHWLSVVRRYHPSVREVPPLSCPNDKFRRISNTSHVPMGLSLEMQLTRSSYLHKHLLSDLCLQRSLSDHQRSILIIFCRSSRQIRLMFLPLSMREVGSFIDMQSKAETTFKSTEMCSQDIWVLWKGKRVSRVSRSTT